MPSRSSRPRNQRRSTRVAQDTGSPGIGRAHVAALVLIVAAAALLRVFAARGELWLDEVWSVALAREISGRPLAVLMDLHHDNNNHLNTLFLTLIPYSSHWILYRLHTLAAGAATVVIGAVIARRAGALASVTAAVLLGGSYWLILYASEARGYTLAVFFSFLGVLLAERYLDTRRALWGAAFGLSGLCGVLSHLLYLHGYLGLFVWTTYRLLKMNDGGRWIRPMLVLHVIPVAALAALYWLDLRHLGKGGSMATSMFDVIVRVLSVSMGGPEDGGLAVLVAVLAIGLCGLAIYAVWRSGSDLWILFAATTVLAPVLTVILARGVPMFERYFVVAIAFLLLGSSWWIVAVARRSAVMAALLVVAVLAGNLPRAWRLIDLGRGSYVPALSYMLANSKRQRVTLTSDHDFRHALAFDFYQRFVPGAYELEYQSNTTSLDPGPEWLLVHSQQRDFTPPTELAAAAGRPYMLAAFYPFAGVSGWHLALYRNRVDIHAP